MTKSRNDLVVKFCPYNDNTLYSLTNKEIWFSRPYELNDIGEISFASGVKMSGKNNIEYINARIIPVAVILPRS